MRLEEEMIDNANEKAGALDECNVAVNEFAFACAFESEESERQPTESKAGCDLHHVSAELNRAVLGSQGSDQNVTRTSQRSLCGTLSSYPTTRTMCLSFARQRFTAPYWVTIFHGQRMFG